MTLLINIKLEGSSARMVYSIATRFGNIEPVFDSDVAANTVKF
jgi:hypothetical protein